jgi:hypothetical protein
VGSPLSNESGNPVERLVGGALSLSLVRPVATFAGGEIRLGCDYPFSKTAHYSSCLKNGVYYRCFAL